MSRRSAIAGVLAASVALAVAPPIHADTSAETRAAADTLYEEAGRLMHDKRWAEACAKLETSQRLDPGIGTLLRLGYCLLNVNDGKGKTASAWAAFNEAEGMARKANDKRAEDAAKQAKLLEPKLSRLLVEIAPENQAAGLEIRRDGKVVDPGLWGAAVPVDPGSHTLEAVKPGKQSWTTTIEVEAKPGVTTVRVPALADAPQAPLETAAAPFWGTQRIVGAVAGGAGLVTIAVSLGLGASARSSNADSLSHCLPTDSTKCYAPGVALRNSALSAADASTGTFVAGAVLLGGGLITMAVVPRTTPKIQVQPSVGLAACGLTVRGEW